MCVCPSLPLQAKEAKEDREGKQFEGLCLKRKSSKDDITIGMHHLPADRGRNICQEHGKSVKVRESWQN